MTFGSCLAAVAALPKPPQYGIARFHVGGQPVEFEISHDDMARDTAWAAGVLRRSGLGPANALLAVGGLFEAPWLAPFTRAATDVGATVAHADRWGWDARRSELFVRRLPVTMLVGLTAEVAQSLVGAEQLEHLSRVPFLLVRPDAVAPLTAAGLSPGTFAKIGPLVAVATSPGQPLEYDAAEWRLDDGDDGELLVSTVGPRLATFDRAPAGCRGRVVEPGRVELA